jgi:GTP cyclohydrolase I
MAATWGCITKGPELESEMREPILAGRDDENGAVTLTPRVADPEDSITWERTAPRRIPSEDWKRYEAYMAEIFASFGMDLDTPGTRDTPRRFLTALFDSTAGYEGDAKLLTAFPTECRGGPDCHISQIIEGPITFYALCEHHSLPFHGVAYVGYVAHENIIGISKLTRLVRMFAKRFTVQERVGQQVADTLVELLSPHGVAVHLDAAHLCTQMRGVREEQSKTWTTFWRGAYESEPEMRREFLRAAGRPRTSANS